MKSVSILVVAFAAMSANSAPAHSPADDAMALLAAHGVSCHAQSDTILHCTQRFISLEREEEFAIHVPSGARLEQDTVIVVLHGLGRNCMTLIDNPISRPVIEASSAFLIFPNGRQSWWIDSSGSRYESYVLELLRDLTDTLHLSSDPRRRGVTGWSMGGFGSLRLIERHPDLFAAWAGILTLADFPNPRYSPEHNHVVPALFGPPSEWEAWQPLTHAPNLRGKQIWFSTGTSAFDRQMNEALDHRLNELRISHQYTTVEGGHEIKVVLEQLPLALRFLDFHLSSQN